MKKILIGLLLILLLISAGAYFVLGNINSIVKNQIEKQGSGALQTQVQVSDVNIQLLDGLGEINGFSIANPEGFSNADALGFKTIRLDIDTNTLTTMPIVIEEVLIDSLSALYEVNAQAKGNLNALLEPLKSSSKGGTGSSESPQSDAGQTDIRITIKKLVVKDTQLVLDLSALGDKHYDETIPGFSLSDIGGAEGLPPEQLGKEIGKRLLSNLLQKAKEKQQDKLADKVKEKAVEELKEKGGDTVKGLLDRFGS